MSALDNFMSEEPLADAYIERYMGVADIERLDGTLGRYYRIYCLERLAKADDIESVYQRDFIAKPDDSPDGEELYLGNDAGEGVTIKERQWGIQ